MKNTPQKKLKILLITYYWHPAGGSGVQRWQKFAKYLKQLNIEPIVYTVKSDLYPLKNKDDASEIKDIEVIRTSHWTPNKLLRFFKNKKQITAISVGLIPSKKSLFDKLVYYIRANFIFPDAKKYWIKPSIKYLQKYLSKNPVDIIISTAPPQTTHFIAYELHQKTNIPWLADCRDPWSEIDFMQKLPLTKKMREKHLFWENTVIKKATAVLTTAPSLYDVYQKINPQTHLITNGYDFTPAKNIDLDQKFTLSHIGLFKDDANPIFLWETLAKIIRENKQFSADFQLHLVGKTSTSVIDTLKKIGLEKHLKISAYLPHVEVKKIQQSTQLLLLLLNQVSNVEKLILGKTFEYMASGRPILATAKHQTDTAKIITQTNTGTCFEKHQTALLKNQIEKWYAAYQQNNLHSKAKKINQYHRKNLTQHLEKVLRRMVK